MTAGTVIVGAGQAGGRTALLLAGRGHGGPVTVIGAEPLAPYERPPLSKGMLADPAAAPAFLAAAGTYAERGVRLLTGRRVTAIDRRDRRVALDDGGSVPYDRLVLATGGQPRRLPFRLARLFVLRTVADVRAIAARAGTARSALVVGGGVIGLEVAATLCGRGLAVTVVEVGSRPLGRNVPEPVATLIAERHRSAGVTIICGERVRAMAEDAEGVVATLSDGAVVRADFAVAGIGIVPETTLARDAGLVVDDGVVVDAAMRSSDPAILAVGDVAARPGPDGRTMRCETWQNAEATAARAAATLLGEPPPPAEAPWFWTDQFDLNVQLCGELDAGAAGARLVEQGASAAGGRLFLALRGRRLVGAVAVNAGRDMSLCRRLVAAAAELPDTLAAAGRFDARAARALLSPAPAPAPASARPAAG
ncbi:NAD(P)/FAD-dependent oxidoreductase [Azospirillum sp. ST 5-10]|uniref:NAD(P)/FAD-dependent oxidoreductase n=1 Tax=unclassified Azospirillum TaxID=2630922 RepID=UPI003F4A266F